MDIFKKYVLPIFDQTQIGCGVIVGSYFITAGHIMQNNLILKTYFNKKAILLQKNNLVSVCYTNDVPNKDFCIFRLNEKISPIQIADYIPISNQTFFCVAYNTMADSRPSSSLKGIWAYKERIEPIITSVVSRKEKQGELFACNSIDVLLKPGNSGSPLFDKDGLLVGILSGGIEKTALCFFQSVLSFRQLVD